MSACQSEANKHGTRNDQSHLFTRGKEDTEHRAPWMCSKLKDSDLSKLFTTSPPPPGFARSPNESLTGDNRVVINAVMRDVDNHGVRYIPFRIANKMNGAEKWGVSSFYKISNIPVIPRRGGGDPRLRSHEFSNNKFS